MVKQIWMYKNFTLSDGVISRILLVILVLILLNLKNIDVFYRDKDKNDKKIQTFTCFFFIEKL